MRKILALFCAMGIVLSLSNSAPISYADDVVYGDVDGDGDVDQDDLSLLRKYIEGGAELDERALEAADINADGRVDITDAVAAGQLLAGADASEDTADEEYADEEADADEEDYTAEDESEDDSGEPESEYDETDTVDEPDRDTEDYSGDEWESGETSDDDVSEDGYYSESDETSSEYIVSPWTETEVDRAFSNGLIPEEMLSENLTRYISREKFAAVAVKLYEGLTGKDAEYGEINKTPFGDCYNRYSDYEKYITAAYRLGITDGVTDYDFRPDDAISREQLATMLCRTIKKSFIDGWSLANDSSFVMDADGVSKFADDADIADFAKNSVYYMVKHGIIAGMDYNMFIPRNISEYQEDGTATKEQALVMALRAYENSGDLGTDYSIAKTRTKDEAEYDVYDAFLKLSADIQHAGADYREVIWLAESEGWSEIRCEEYESGTGYKDGSYIPNYAVFTSEEYGDRITIDWPGGWTATADNMSMAYEKWR